MEAANFWTLLADQAATRAAALLAVDEQGRTLTVGECYRQALRVAAALQQRGVGSGTVVSWIVPTWLEAIVLMGALSRLGAIQNPILPILRDRDVEFIARQAQTALLITPAVWRGFDYAAMARAVAGKIPALDLLVVDRALPETDGGDLSQQEAVGSNDVRWYFYTSGTTAEPKGARHTDQSLDAASRHQVLALGLSASDRLPLITPISHIGGPLFVMSALRTGASLILDEGFERARTAELLRRSQATFGGPGAPFIAAFLAYQREHPDLAPLLPHARAYLSGGAPKSSTLFYEAMRELKAPTLSGWGMTEAPMLTFNHFGDEEVALATTEGRPGPGVDLISVRSDGTQTAVGEEGELRIKAPQLMRGYLDVQLNADAFDAEGYFRTGDLGRVDAHGNVTITGRLKDVIIRNMENISAKAVEDGLLTHPKVADVAVIAVPDPKTGERACAVVVPKKTDDAPNLPELCDHLGRQGMIKRNFPEQLEILEQLPRTPTGKVLKVELRKRYGAR